MDNSENKEAQEALKTLNKIKKALKIIAYIFMLVVFGVSLLIVHQQEQYIEQLNTKLRGLENEVGNQGDKYRELDIKVTNALKNNDKDNK